MASSDRPARGPARLPPGTDLIRFLLSLPPEARSEAVRRLGETESDSFDGDWKTWAHDGQTEPAGCADGSEWNVWVIMAGRGFGKTLAGAKWIEAQLAAAAEAGVRLRIALVGATLAEARRVMVEGKSGLLEVAGHAIREWRPTLGLLRFRGGSEAQLFSGASPEQLRGPEHDLAWCDELAKWEKPGETWDMIQLGLRLGTRPRVLVTTTPRPGPHLKRIMASPRCVVTGGPTRANPHLPAAFVDNVHQLYAGTRLARQELEGELLPDAPGALWTEALLERCRLLSPSPSGEGSGVGPVNPAPNLRQAPPPSPPLKGRGGFPHESTAFVRLVIAVDPPSGDGTCGIIACAKDEEGRAHVLADHSVTGRTPEGWARAVADAAKIWSIAPLRNGEGDRSPPANGGGDPSPIPVQIVAESNQGGLMVQSVLRIADPKLRVKLVTATQGKSDRASPVAMLFEAGKVTLHGRFPELEAQLCGMIAGGGYEGPGNSPDRADAMVWALTELMLQPQRAPRLRSL